MKINKMDEIIILSFFGMIAYRNWLVDVAYGHHLQFLLRKPYRAEDWEIIYNPYSFTVQYVTKMLTLTKWTYESLFPEDKISPNKV